MFIFILFLSSVAAEWVEISQFHTEKPLRIYSKPSTKVVKNDSPFRKHNSDNHHVNNQEKPRRVPEKPSLKFSENKSPFRSQDDQSLYTSPMTERYSWTFNKLNTIQPNENDISVMQHNNFYFKSKAPEEAEPFWKQNKPSSPKLAENTEPTLINNTFSFKSENQSPFQKFESSVKEGSNGKIIRKNPGTSLFDTSFVATSEETFKSDKTNGIDNVSRIQKDPKKDNLRRIDRDEKTKSEYEKHDHLDHITFEEEIPKGNKIYLNSSLPYNRNKDTISKVPNFGNVQRVNIDRSDVRRPELDLEDFKTQKFMEEERKQNNINSRTEDSRNRLLNNILTTPKYKSENDRKLFIPSDLNVDTNNQDEQIKASEVHNLSDLEYISEEDIFPNIKTSDVKEAGLAINTNKHLIASILTNNKIVNEPVETMTDKIKNINDKQNISDSKVVKETSSETQLTNLKTEREKGISETKTVPYSNIEFEKEIETAKSHDTTNIKYNSGATHNAIKQNSKVDKIKLDVSRDYNKTFVPVKRITIPDPEEVMIKEIIETENNFKVNADWQRYVQNSKLSTQNKFTTVLPKLVSEKSSNRKPGTVKKVTQPETNLVDKTTFTDANVKQIKSEITSKNISNEISAYKVAKYSSNNVKRTDIKSNATLVDKELASIYMNENVEIIRQVQVTSTEEIPIRTTIRINPLKSLNHEASQNMEQIDFKNNNYAIKQQFDTKDVTKLNSVEATTEQDSGNTYLLPTTANIDRTTNKTKHVPLDSNIKSEFHNDTNDLLADEKDNAAQSKEKLKHEKIDFQESVAEDTNVKAMKNLLTFLKVVTETISKNTKQSLKGKLRYLEDLRDTLMANIEQRLDVLFPDDKEGGGRRGRSAQARGHHVEFHSSEGALMSISFLTFAVFLVKLVMQLVHTYKNKTVMMPTVVASVGRTLHKYYHSD